MADEALGVLDGFVVDEGVVRAFDPMGRDALIVEVDDEGIVARTMSVALII